MKRLFWLTRWIIGILFIFSGLIKANDPSGLSYKMHEFFEAWETTQFIPFSLYFSFLMNTFEIVAGMAILVKWHYRLTLKLLLILIVFFTFLTGYALFSGKIATCGCFGDCLPLTPLQSFLKDLFLLILILFLLIFNKKSSQFSFSANWVIGSFIMAISIQFYVLKHLPFIDCLPYKIGKNIVKQMETPANAIPDKMAIFLQYNKKGQIIEFEQTKFPEDFDTSYKFLGRKDKLIAKGNGLKAAISDFSLKTMNGIDTSEGIFNQDKKYILIFSLYTDKFDKWTELFKKLDSDSLQYFIVTADIETAKKLFSNKNLLQADATSIKTAARVNPTLFLMHKADIINKKAAVDIDKLFKAEHAKN